MTDREKLKKRQKAIRSRIFGTPEKPRLLVFRSLKHVYAQIIDDTSGKVLLSEKDFQKEEGGKKKEKGKIEKAFKLGERIAKKAEAKKIKKVVFDRRGYLYHGRVKAVAEGARKGGLEF